MKKMKRMERSNLDTPALEKIFEKVFKNLLTNPVIYGIIYTERKKEVNKMKTKTLTEYVEHQLALCHKIPNEVFFHNAFGAIEYHLWMYHEDNKEIYDRWDNEWKPEFEKLIWGNEK